MNALELFRRGHDTQQIADLLHLEEYEVYNEIARLKGDLGGFTGPKPAPPSRSPEYRQAYASHKNSIDRARLAEIREAARL